MSIRIHTLVAALVAAVHSAPAPAQVDPAAATPATPATAPADPAAPAATPAAATPPAAAVPAPAVPAGLDATSLLKGDVKVRDKRFYIAEYRVLFEMSGRVSANTRAAYFGGRDYGATSVSVNYQVPKHDLGLLQAVTDRAFADFVARLEAAGMKPEPAEGFMKEHGAVYESSVEPSKPGAEVFEEVDLGYGKRKYLVLAPTGTRTVARSFVGLGAGNISKRIEFSKGNMEAISVNIAVNLAAQESSGGGSSMFKRGSNANASAAMEIANTRGMGVVQAHANGGAMIMNTPLAVPGDFATLREVGGYDTQKDAAVTAINLLGRMAFGVAGKNSKRVDMQLDVDSSALAKQSLQGLMAVNHAAVSNLK